MPNVFSQQLYTIENVTTIELTFQQANWDQLLDNLVAAGNEERLLGMVSINGQVFDSVGVRYKGNSTYSANRIKNPFNIKLDYIIDDQEYEGYGTLKLANVFKDPSFVREVLGYEIARNYFPAPLANYANVYVNGTLIGLYTSDQDVDKFFGRTHFSTDEKVRVKGEIAEGLPPGSMGDVWEYISYDSTDYYSLYAMESDFGWIKLMNFIDTLNYHNEQIEKHLNVDRHLWFLAFSNLFVNLDGPINNPQNYYLFEDPSGRFNPIPWDLNECFGVFTNLQSQGNLSITQLQQLNPYVNISHADYPVISKILSNPDYKKMYVAHIKTIIEEQISNGFYEERALEIQQIIDSYVQADPNKFYTYANFISNINVAVGGSGPPPNQQIVGLTQLMEARKNYLLNLADFSGQAPILTNHQFFPVVVQQGDEITFQLNASNANQVYIAFRSARYASFEVLPLFDDGNHGDINANDGIYGNTLLANTSRLEYYFYAMNNLAATFLPQRAANEFFTINMTGSLVINEFMADNESTVTDQDGDYEDWVELYNNSAEAVNLNGYYLSDNLAVPDKWMFADTILEAGAFLIIWADEDEDQQGLHANFKLSKGGESILLSNPQLVSVDMITFGAQQTDISTGRFPNGTGDFIFMSPSWGETNLNGITGIDVPEESAFLTTKIYPNPFSNQLNMEFNLSRDTYVEIDLVNILGQSITAQKQISLPAGWQKLTIQTNELPPGIWFCKIKTGETLTIFKLIK